MTSSTTDKAGFPPCLGKTAQVAVEEAAQGSDEITVPGSVQKVASGDMA